MLKKSIPFIVLVVIFGLSACKTEFEKVRLGNDIELKYQKAIEFYDNEDWYRAQVLLEQITGILRGDPRIEKVYFYYAYTHFNQRKYLLASYYFRNFYETFPNSIYTEEALFMTAFSNYKLSPVYRLDQTNTDKAIDDFQLYVNTFPLSDRVQRANALMDEMRAKLEKKAWEDAELYYKLQDFQAAHHSYENFLRDFPDAQNVERARFMVVKASFKMAQNTVEINQQEKFEETVEAFNDFVDRHPNSRFQKEAESIYQTSVERITKLNEETK